MEERESRRKRISSASYKRGGRSPKKRGFKKIIFTV